MKAEIKSAYGGIEIVEIVKCGDRYKIVGGGYRVHASLERAKQMIAADRRFIRFI